MFTRHVLERTSGTLCITFKLKHNSTDNSCVLASNMSLFIRFNLLM